MTREEAKREFWKKKMEYLKDYLNIVLIEF